MKIFIILVFVYFIVFLNISCRKTMTIPTPTSIPTPTKSPVFNLEVYPNPFVKDFNVIIFPTDTFTHKCNISILDLTGKIWFQLAFNTKNKHQINIDNIMPDGIYLVQIFFDSTFASNKIIKSK